MPSSAARILVVDDNLSWCRLVAEVLRGEGYEVEFTGSPEAALVHLHRCRHALVVSDVGLPRIRGPELVARMRRVQPRLPVVLVSSFPDPATWAEARSLGVPLLAKPLRPKVLLALVRTLLGAFPRISDARTP